MESTKPRKQKVEPGPEHPTDESQAGVSYLSFDDLQEPRVETEEEQQSLVGHLIEIANTCHLSDADWKAQYEAVNIMRALNKFNRQLLLAHIDKLGKFVRQQIDNLRSNLSKNSLLFLKEFGSIKSNSGSTGQTVTYSQNDSQNSCIQDETQIRSFITQVYPVALLKTIYEKNFIVLEAKASMNYAVQNLLYPELILVLLEGCKAKNITLAEYSINYLTTLVKNMDGEYFLSGEPAIQQLVQLLQIEFEGKRMKIKKASEVIFQELKLKVGKERIQTVIQESLQGMEGAREKIDNVMKLFEEKAVKKADQSRNFRSFLKQQKQQVNVAFETSSTSSITIDIPNQNDQMIIQ